MGVEIPMIAALTLGLLLQVEVDSKHLEDFGYLKRQGVLVGYPDQAVHYYRPVFREEGTKIILGCYDTWFKYLGEVPSDRYTISLAQAPSAKTEEAQGNLEALIEMSPGVLRSISRLMTAYIPDIRRHDPKRDVPSMLRRLALAEREIQNLRIPDLGESYRPFKDMPRGHWAEDAVHNLRRAGMIWGYPDGTFTGRSSERHASEAWKAEFDQLVKANFFVMSPEKLNPPVPYDRLAASTQAIYAYNALMEIGDVILDGKSLHSALRSIELDEKFVPPKPLTHGRYPGRTYHNDFNFLKSESINIGRIANLILLLGLEIDANPASPLSAAKMVANLHRVQAILRDLKIPEVGQGSRKAKGE